MNLSFDEFWKRYENEFDWDENNSVMLAAKDAWETALAQQTQSLTDEMIVAEAKRRGIPAAPSDYARVDAISLARWARDRMAQQAQPEPDNYVDPEYIRGFNDGFSRAKQAQPETPTREMVMDICLDEDVTNRIVALFASKETYSLVQVERESGIMWQIRDRGGEIVGTYFTEADALGVLARRQAR